MRCTKASLIYRRTKNLRAVQLLLGHTKLESTVRYLGIEVDDALELAEQTEVRSPFKRRICWITGFGGPSIPEGPRFNPGVPGLTFVLACAILLASV